MTTIIVLAVAGLVLFIVLRGFLFQPFSIPTSSMSPTLLVGDYVVVSKYSYGYGRYSVPFGLIPFEGRIWEHPVERGDIAVFRSPLDPSVDYIKRIVGLPGDRIQIKSGILHIDGEPVERKRIEDYEIEPGRFAPQYVETLSGDRAYRVVEELGDVSTLDNTPEFAIPPEHYFALGDNRDKSQDSRNLGSIPSENLIGRATLRIRGYDFSTDFDQTFGAAN